MRKTIFLCSLVIFTAIAINSCKGQSVKKYVWLENAKFYFYCYAASLDGYLIGNKPITPMKCEIKTISVNKVSPDTIKAYFNLYYKDTLNFCSLKPYGLVGITIIKGKFYLPIYHLVVFEDYENDSLMLSYMNKHREVLKNKIAKDQNDISFWLKENIKYYK